MAEELTGADCATDGSAIGASSLPIVCSLAGPDVEARLEEWHGLMARVISRQRIDGGLHLLFEPSTSPVMIADLAAREHACCPFFDFALPASEEVPVLEVRAPAAAQAIIDDLFGENG